jgi:hypothetical protein
MGQSQSGEGACAGSPGHHAIRFDITARGRFSIPSAARLQCRAAPAVAISPKLEHAKAALPAPQNQKSRLGKHDYLPLVDFIFEEGPQCHDSWEPSQRHQRFIFALDARALLPALHGVRPALSTNCWTVCGRPQIYCRWLPGCPSKPLYCNGSTVMASPRWHRCTPFLLADPECQRRRSLQHCQRSRLAASMSVGLPRPHHYQVQECPCCILTASQLQ